MNPDLRVLELEPRSEDRFGAHHPANDPEGRNVVFSGQLLAQMIMAADRSIEGLDVKAIHAVFSRAGTYEHPLEYSVETTHAGRTFGSTTVTAIQNDRLLSRGMVLMSAYEDDFLRHGPAAPDAPDPESMETDEAYLGFPGTETRTIQNPDETTADGTPSLTYWVRTPGEFASPAANAAALVWSQPGQIIGLAFRPHRDHVSIGDAHRTISTGVIAHTAHFHERIDVTEWHLVRQEATLTAHGRVFGVGRIFDRDGNLVATFEQESMAKSADRPLDPSRSM